MSRAVGHVEKGKISKKGSAGISKEAKKGMDNVKYKLLSGQNMVLNPSADDSDSTAELGEYAGQKKEVKATRVAQAIKKKVKRVTQATVLTEKSAEGKLTQ